MCRNPVNMQHEQKILAHSRETRKCLPLPQARQQQPRPSWQCLKCPNSCLLTDATLSSSTLLSASKQLTGTYEEAGHGLSALQTSGVSKLKRPDGTLLQVQPVSRVLCANQGAGAVSDSRMQSDDLHCVLS